MKSKPATININLVPKDPFYNTTLGRTLQWALSVGRYIVIFTLIVVIMSFIARFTLDRQVSDLNKKLINNKNVIESYGDLEQKFRLAQAQINEYKQIDQETNLAEVFANLTAVTPQDILIDQLTISPTTVIISGSSFSQSSFSLLITNLQLSPNFLNVSVGKVEAKENNAPGFIFQITADTKAVKRVNNQVKTEEEVGILDRTQGL